MRRDNISGININPLTIKEATEQIRAWIKQGSTHFVSIASVNNIISASRDKKLKRIQNSADMTTTDGMPLVWFLRLCGYKDIDRVCGIDLMLTVLGITEKEGFSNFFYGCTDKTLDSLENSLKRIFPKLKIAGKYAPPFRPLTEEENIEIVNRIHRAKPQLIWIGLSTPKQEFWMYENRGRLRDCVMIGVGAAFDFVTGKIRRAPKWMRDMGLEWFYRLIQEPKRLWRRYLMGNSIFIMLLLKEFFKRPFCMRNEKRDAKNRD